MHTEQRVSRRLGPSGAQRPGHPAPSGSGCRSWEVGPSSRFQVMPKDSGDSRAAFHAAPGAGL